MNIWVKSMILLLLAMICPKFVEMCFLDGSGKPDSNSKPKCAIEDEKHMAWLKRMQEDPFFVWDGSSKNCDEDGFYEEVQEFYMAYCYYCVDIYTGSRKECTKLEKMRSKEILKVVQSQGKKPCKQNDAKPKCTVEHEKYMAEFKRRQEENRIMTYGAPERCDEDGLFEEVQVLFMTECYYCVDANNGSAKECTKVAKKSKKLLKKLQSQGQKHCGQTDEKPKCAVEEEKYLAWKKQIEAKGPVSWTGGPDQCDKDGYYKEIQSGGIRRDWSCYYCVDKFTGERKEECSKALEGTPRC